MAIHALHAQTGVSRRTVIAAAAACAAQGGSGPTCATPAAPTPEPRWYEAALSMKLLAESWGDQPYGAVLVLDGKLIGEGPSRVVKNRDASAHAEREAIRDAQSRSGKTVLSRAVLYSTSRPCPMCEDAAAQAGVARMYFGPMLTDAGAPRSARR